MKMFIIDQDLELWHTIQNGPLVPIKKNGNEEDVSKAENEFNQEDLDKVTKNDRAINLLYCGLHPYLLMY